MKRIASCLVAAAVLVLASGASAQEKSGRTITLTEVTIVGRVQLPIASVDVNKIQPKLTLAELKQPFLDRIEAATKSEPF